MPATAAQHRDRLQRRADRLGPLVGLVRQRAGEGLLHGVGGQDTEHDRQARVELDPLDPGGALAGHELVVPGVPPDDRPQADHRVDARGGGQALREERELEGARSPGDSHTAEVASRSLERVECTGEQPVGDAAVERCTGAGRIRDHGRRPMPSPPVPSRAVPTRAAALCLASGRSWSGQRTSSRPSRRCPIRSRLVRRYSMFLNGEGVRLQILTQRCRDRGPPWRAAPRTWSDCW